MAQCADEAAPPALRRLNDLFFSGEERNFASGLAGLAAALRVPVGAPFNPGPICPV
jgi:hypothetical protein